MTDTGKKRKVIFSVTSCIPADQRVQRMASSVSSLDCEIVVAGRERRHCTGFESLPFTAKRFRMFFTRGFLFYMFFNIRLFFYLLLHRADLLVANDLDTLLPNFLASRLKNIPLVYDSHEFFTGVPELRERPFVRSVWRSIEAFVFPRLKHVMTVSESVAKRYHELYGIKPVVIRNMAWVSEQIIPYSREELGVNEDELIIVFQGTGINIQRGGEELVRAVLSSERVLLLIIGDGDVVPELRMLAGSSEKIRFIPALPWPEMMRYTRSADAGVSLDKPSNDNYRFSLPNKIFDYISAGIPVIAGELPEVGKLIREYNCGIIIGEVTPGNISGAFTLLRSDAGLLGRLKENTRMAATVLNWDRESAEVKAFYSRILNISEA